MMKQSNWILGLGILVAVLLIAGSLYLEAKPLPSQNEDISTSMTSIPETMVKKLSVKPIVEVSERLVRFLSKK